MAELLIKAVDATHPDPEIDAAGCYKEGMVVVVMPDGHEWGREEGPPKFVVAKLPGVSVEKTRKYMDELKETDAKTGEPKTVRRRRWQIDKAKMDPAAYAAIKEIGKVMVDTSLSGDVSPPAMSRTADIEPVPAFPLARFMELMIDTETGESETESLI